MRRTMLVAATAALLMAGCAQSKKTVKEEELAQVPPANMGEVNSWRQRVDQAQDQASRAEVAIKDAKAQQEVAESEVRVAKSEKNQAEKQLEAAEQTRNTQAAQTARSQISAAEARIKAAEAHVDAQKASVEVAQARKKVADKQTELAQAQLEEAKFQALQKTGDPSASRYSQADFDARKANIQADLSKLNTEAQQKQQEYSDKQAAWQQQRNRLEASGPQPPRG